MKKKIIWVHGTKGGIGKSLMACVTVDYLMQRYGNGSVAIIEGDGSVPDVQRRFGDSLPSLLSPLNDKKSVYSMLEGIEDASTTNITHIVVNLPANAELLDSVAGDVKCVTDELGYTNHVMFMISESADSAELAGKSTDKGLISISDSAVAVINKHFGENAESFSWFSSGMRDRFMASETHAECIFNSLQERVKSHDKFLQGELSRLAASDSPLKVVDRIVLRRWLSDSYEIVNKVLTLGDPRQHQSESEQGEHSH